MILSQLVEFVVGLFFLICFLFLCVRVSAIREDVRLLAYAVMLQHPEGKRPPGYFELMKVCDPARFKELKAQARKQSK